MKKDLHERAGGIFLEALALSPQKRRIFLADLSQKDAALLAEVESLLEHHVADDPFLLPRADVPKTDAPKADAAGPEPDDPRLESGQIFAGRYRILNRLGRGGLGEVYRAHDQVLGQDVAIKILIGRDGEGGDSLLREARLARSVTHPAVCRVFDVSTTKGERFVTMELIDGEDLASLLRRVGRLPPERVLELTYQLLAGLAAAHGKGIVHGDLKPANILIDSKGLAHITDFGVARHLTDTEPSGLSGTPGYMAPEQWSSRTVDERSDLYSLGLLLYEALTGHAAFDAPTLAAWVRIQRTSRPKAPSSEISAIDPGFEKVLLRVLDRDPQARPQSALEMVAALPGINALALAREIGVTPPVDVVAASQNSKSVVSVRAAIGLFGLTLVALIVMLPLSRATHPLHRSRPSSSPVLSPSVLEHKAASLVDELSAQGGAVSKRQSGFLNSQAEDAHPTQLLFWFRQRTERFTSNFSKRVLGTPTDGQRLVVLDTLGNLIHLDVDPAPIQASLGAVPSRTGDPVETSQTISRLFEAANLEPRDFQSSELYHPLPIYVDERRAWRSSQDSQPVKTVEVGFIGKRPVYFHSSAFDPLAPESPDELPLPTLLGALFVFGALLAAVPLAWSNLKRDRSDRRGAKRLLGFVLIFFTLAWFSRTSALTGPGASLDQILLQGIGLLVLHGAWVWIAYIALEPFARREWPESLIAWTRLLGGSSWTDPAIARSALVGCLAGSVLAVLFASARLAAESLGLEAPVLRAELANASFGLRETLSSAAASVPSAIYNGFVLLLVLVFLSTVIKSRRVALAVFIGMTSLLFFLLTANSNWVTAIYAVAFVCTATFLLVRVGVLAYSLALWIQGLLVLFPLTLSSEPWFAQSGVFPLVLTSCLAAIACHATIRGSTGADGHRHRQT